MDGVNKTSTVSEDCDDVRYALENAAALCELLLPTHLPLLLICKCCTAMHNAKKTACTASDTLDSVLGQCERRGWLLRQVRR